MLRAGSAAVPMSVNAPASSTRKLLSRVLPALLSMPPMLPQLEEIFTNVDGTSSAVTVATDAISTLKPTSSTIQGLEGQLFPLVVEERVLGEMTDLQDRYFETTSSAPKYADFVTAATLIMDVLAERFVNTPYQAGSTNLILASRAAVPDDAYFRGALCFGRNENVSSVTSRPTLGRMYDALYSPEFGNDSNAAAFINCAAIPAVMVSACVSGDTRRYGLAADFLTAATEAAVHSRRKVCRPPLGVHLAPLPPSAEEIIQKWSQKVFSGSERVSPSLWVSAVAHTPGSAPSNLILLWHAFEFRRRETKDQYEASALEAAQYLACRHIRQQAYTAFSVRRAPANYIICGSFVSVGAKHCAMEVKLKRSGVPNDEVVQRTEVLFAPTADILGTVAEVRDVLLETSGHDEIYPKRTSHVSLPWYLRYRATVVSHVTLTDVVAHLRNSAGPLTDEDCALIAELCQQMMPTASKKGLVHVCRSGYATITRCLESIAPQVVIQSAINSVAECAEMTAGLLAQFVAVLLLVKCDKSRLAEKYVADIEAAMRTVQRNDLVYAQVVFSLKTVTPAKLPPNMTRTSLEMLVDSLAKAPTFTVADWWVLFMLIREQTAIPALDRRWAIGTLKQYFGLLARREFEKINRIDPPISASLESLERKTAGRVSAVTLYEGMSFVSTSSMSPLGIVRKANQLASRQLHSAPQHEESCESQTAATIST